MARRSAATKLVKTPAWAKHDYSGAHILDAKPGPRRELTLHIELWPMGKATFGGGLVVRLRFGAIANYEEVRRFFSNLPKEELHYLRFLSESRPRRNLVEMEFDRTGDRIKIIARNVSDLETSPRIPERQRVVTEW